MLEWLSNFHFIRPLWLLMILPCLWLLYRFALHQKSSSGWSSAIDAELLQVQLAPGTQAKRSGITALLGSGLLLGSIALAGPAWERLPQPVEQKREALVIVLDLSLSMYAQDLSPSRLVRARQKITDILRERKEGFTAMVAYAGDAHAVAPLTDDTGTIENLVAALNPSMMPALGSNVGLGIEAALRLLENATVADARILLITDGIDRIGDVTRHSNPRIPISIIGVGTPEGASIPLDFVNQPGRILRDEEGDAIVAKLDYERLSTIAELCHGFYSDLTLNMTDIATTLPPLSLEDDAILSDRRFDSWADVGPWIVLILVPLMLLAFRRGAIAVLLVGLVVPDARAGLWEDLWQRRDQQAHAALTHGAPEAAAVLFENPDWKAAAQYRAGEFDKSAAHYSASLGQSPDKNPDLVADYYNLGNSLAKAGQLDAAIAAYNSALELEPEHSDAKFNKDLIEQAKEQPPGESSDKDNQESQENSNEDSDQEREPQSESDGSDEQQQDESQEQSDSQEGEEKDQSQEQQQSPEDAEEQKQEQLAQEATEEQKAAMEQWLRRVPDEPGGLLRRKFKYETDQRRREGNYQPKAKKIW